MIKPVYIPQHTKAMFDKVAAQFARTSRADGLLSRAMTWAFLYQFGEGEVKARAEKELNIIRDTLAIRGEQ